jgi:hypothetical protein
MKDLHAGTPHATCDPSTCTRCQYIVGLTPDELTARHDIAVGNDHGEDRRPNDRRNA